LGQKGNSGLGWYQGWISQKGKCGLVVMNHLSLLIPVGPPPTLAWVLIGVIVLIAVLASATALRVHRRQPMPECYWKGGIFYVNDPGPGGHAANRLGRSGGDMGQGLWVLLSNETLRSPENRLPIKKAVA
jgi:hypothetical protein